MQAGQEAGRQTETAGQQGTPAGAPWWGVSKDWSKPWAPESHSRGAGWLVYQWAHWGSQDLALCSCGGVLGLHWKPQAPLECSCCP